MVGVFSELTFLASWLFGQLTFWRLTISPSIDKVAVHADREVLVAVDGTSVLIVGNPKGILGLHLRLQPIHF